MKTFFTISFILLLFSCSVAKNSEKSSIHSDQTSVNQDSTLHVKPLILNGKVVSPSPNNATIIP